MLVVFIISKKKSKINHLKNFFFMSGSISEWVTIAFSKWAHSIKDRFQAQTKTFFFHFFLSRFGFLIKVYYIREMEMNIGALENKTLIFFPILKKSSPISSSSKRVKFKNLIGKNILISKNFKNFTLAQSRKHQLKFSSKLEFSRCQSVALLC